MKLEITQSDFEKIQSQLAEKQKKLDELGLGLGDAMSRSGSFPSANPEYAAVHLEMKNLQTNVDNLKKVLSKYTVTSIEKIDTKKISIYSSVILNDLETNEQICYYISLAELDKKLEGDCYLATPESPVGQALLGHKIDDTVEITLPVGTKKYLITGHTKEY